MLFALSDFPQFPNSEEIPLCELEGRIQYVRPESASLHLFTSSVSSHPNVVISRENLHHMTSKHVGSKVFLPVTDSLWQKLQTAWYEKGFTQVLEILADPRQNQFIVGQVIANYLLYVNNFLSKLSGSYQRQAETRHFNGEAEHLGIVVCIAWHPHCSKLAVATRDDAVSIFSIMCTLNPVLKAKTQRHVTSIAWRPLSSCEIAVGCYEGVYVWSVDPNSVISRPSINCATLLQTPGHKGINSVAWSPQGDILASASPLDNTVYIWNVEMEANVPLKRVGGGGVGILSWCPDGSRLFAGTTTKVFRIWNCEEEWEPESWCTLGGKVVAAVWAPGGRSLVFATSTEPFLYAVPSSKTSVFTRDKRTAAHVIGDLTPIQLETGERVGGEVRDMVWDNKGRHLAIMFKDCEVIAIFYSNIEPHFHLAPGFFIKGQPGDIPLAIAFQNDFSEGANLTIVWHNGRVQYFPIIFTWNESFCLPSIKSNSFSDQTVKYYSFSSP